MNDINWGLASKREILERRARIMQRIRAFFIARDYLEIETPHRIPANAPEPHIQAIGSDGWFLQTSPELAMKRLLAADYGNIFQLCRVWRDGERGRLHLPEFTLLEWYRVNVDYRPLMDECVALFTTLTDEQPLQWQGQTVDLTPPWEELTVKQAFARHASLSLEAALAADRFEEILTGEVEPRLGINKPTFLCEYPASLAALARRKPGRPEVAERFELYVCGLELANAFSELVEPREQKERFLRDLAIQRTQGRPPTPLPEKFLGEMENMPEAAGIALGVDRLVMLLTNCREIGDVVAFTPENL